VEWNEAGNARSFGDVTGLARRQMPSFGGDMQPVSRLVRGGLAPWQERRAKEMIAANLGGVPLKELARECRLSMSYFSQASRVP
jgi:hypothetical protein